MKLLVSDLHTERERERLAACSCNNLILDVVGR
jgi:hypothetical protein